TEKVAGTIAIANHDARLLGLKSGTKPGSMVLPSVIVAGKPIASRAQREAVQRVVEYVDLSGFHTDGPYPAIGDLLLRRPPRIQGRQLNEPIQTLNLSNQEALVLGLDRSALAIQGPPGSGKTWTAARLIVSALQSGARVGIAAFSHRAVGNV